MSHMPGCSGSLLSLVAIRFFCGATFSLDITQKVPYCVFFTDCYYHTLYKRIWSGSHLIRSRVPHALLTRFKKLDNQALRGPERAKCPYQILWTWARYPVRVKSGISKHDQLPLLTGIHSHLMQYMTPKGGPRSANHTEPISCRDFPNWHSVTENRGGGKSIYNLGFPRRRVGSPVLLFKTPEEFTITIIIADLHHITGHEETWSLTLITRQINFRSNSASEGQASTILLCSSYRKISLIILKWCWRWKQCPRVVYHRSRWVSRWVSVLFCSA
jgi:hypothetical protein